MKLLIKKARVIDPSQKLDRFSDILIEDGKIKKIALLIYEKADVEIDASGCIAAPGFIDVHVHFRDPGFEYKEDIISGAKAALRGGFTAVACMANTKPVTDSVDTVKYIVDKAKDTGVKVYPIAAMTKGMKGEEMCDFAALKAAGAIAVSDDGRPVENLKMMRDVLNEADRCDILSIAHSEEMSLAKGGVINEGDVSHDLKVGGIPNAAEYMAVARDAAISIENQNRLHIAHVSCKESVEAMRLAKERNPNLTCETAPHYTMLTDEAVRVSGVNAKMNPPLRSAEDVEAIIEGLCDGTIDAIATDHAPHSQEDKGTLDKGAFGIVGLETSLAVSYTSLVAPSKTSIRMLIRLMSTNPAAILGVPGGTLKEGSPADIVIFDTEEFTVDKNTFASKSKNTPFDGMKLRGRVRYTISDGKIVYKNENI